ncbi:hypothetical protein [Arcobacter porcinus]|uniref:Uncharacterized protein n=1 Tax=Arcobacter porcinus TaxID=1935204 RepID=A0A5C2HCF8_9BACT|nr:hypothetical protein [Arcobacter porcinus]OCL96742.1 hypothetical protein AAX27_00374 [Aliarcobacter thereius]QEP40573.1 hypothetical protein APORC_0971 [Arcobacter porcinus]
MKLNKIIDKIKKFLKKDKLKNSQEEKVLKIIEDLKKKRAKIKQEIREASKQKKDSFKKELRAVNKLIKKSKTLI